MSARGPLGNPAELMKFGSPLSRYAIGVRDQIHEWAVTRAEQQILSFLVRKQALQEACGRTQAASDSTAWALAVFDRNQTRIAEIEGRKSNKIAMACRWLLHRIPNPARDRLRGVIRTLFTRVELKAAAKSASGQPAPCKLGPMDDTALAVPFGQSFLKPRLDQTVGVIVHVYYPELAKELREYLENIPGSVDVYISTDTKAKRDIIEGALGGWSKGRFEVRLAVNRGRDIAPKLITFEDVYDRHPFVLHLHTKKSPHHSTLKLWRHFILENLIGDEDVASSILAALEKFPEIGMVTSQHYLGVRGSIGWAGNLELAETLGRRMGVEIDANTPLDFPSGSMFWARSAALKPLLDLKLSFDDFAPESGQSDGTMAHAIERLYFHACEVAGYRWIKVCRPALTAGADKAPVHIGDNKELIVYLQCKGGGVLSRRQD